MTSIYFMMISGISMMTITQKHTLNLLIIIEFSSLATLLMMSMNTSMSSCPPFLILTLLTLIACEGTIGLSLIISIARFKGNDMYSSPNIMK